MVSRFADRLDEATYRRDEPFHFGVAREGQEPERLLSVPGRLFDRMKLVAEAYDLHAIPLVDPYWSERLDLTQAQSLLEELEFLAGVAGDPLLRGVIEDLSGVVRRVTSSAIPLDLVVVGP